MQGSAHRPQRRVVIEPRELEQLLRAETLRLARKLLPNGMENCGYYEIGSVAGDKGQSLKINLSGSLKGCWTDFSAPKGTLEYSGDMLKLIAITKFGGRLGDAISWAISWLGLDGLDPARLATERATAKRAAIAADEDQAAQAEKRRRNAMNLYLSGTSIADTPAERYLISRGIDLRAHGMAAPGSLKYQADGVYCMEVQRKLPCMVAAVTNIEGRHVATHRTWIKEDGSGKADLKEPKKALGKYQGGFIPIWKGDHKVSMANLPKGTPILCSEGIEDALTAAIARPQHRVIAAISLSNIGGLVLPDGCPLIILAQRDPPGSKAEASLEQAIARQQEAGRDVRLAFPPAGVKDINDLATKSGAQRNGW